MSAQAKQCWRGAVSVGSGLGRHRSQVLQDDGVSLTLSWTAAKAMRFWFAVVDLRCCEARAMMRRVQWLPDVLMNVRITAVSQCIPMLSRGCQEVAPHPV